MEGVETVIVRALMRYQAYSSELTKVADKLWHGDDICLEKRAMILEDRLATMDSWLSILDMHELFVVMLRLVEGRSCSQTAHEYKRAMGGAEADEDAMCRIQARAIAKIAGVVRDEFESELWFFSTL